MTGERLSRDALNAMMAKANEKLSAAQRELSGGLLLW